MTASLRLLGEAVADVEELRARLDAEQRLSSWVDLDIKRAKEEGL